MFAAFQHIWDMTLKVSNAGTNLVSKTRKHSMVTVIYHYTWVNDFTKLTAIYSASSDLHWIPRCLKFLTTTLYNLSFLLHSWVSEGVTITNSVLLNSWSLVLPTNTSVISIHAECRYSSYSGPSSVLTRNVMYKYITYVHPVHSGSLLNSDSPSIGIGIVMKNLR